MASSLSKYFVSVGAKRLSQVEVDPETSHQHELNGISGFKNIFGLNELKFTAKFIYLSDDEDNIIENIGHLKWYDARENHPTRTEYRLYYSDNQVIPFSSSGDLIIVARTGEDTAVVLVAQGGSTSETQLLWLFDLNEVENKFIVKDLTEEKSDIGFAGRYIISSLGIEIEEPLADLDSLIKKFGKTFPSTSEFSAYARSIVKGVSIIEAPDEALIAWLEKEESLFRALEGIIVKEKLKTGFGKDGTDVDEFISFSLSVQNRRKSRAGHSFENHLAIIFRENNISFSKGSLTERNNKPDFLFPGNSFYHDAKFNIELLTMLGVKTTAKDRWRQILSEADKISNKHLITLEPSISKNQTEEMRAQNLQLVLPKSIILTYQKEQQDQIISLSDFIKHVANQQSSLGNFSNTLF
jgi:hypothetical protein